MSNWFSTLIQQEIMHYGDYALKGGAHIILGLVILGPMFN